MIEDIIKIQFCINITKAIEDENKGFIEYTALALDSLELDEKCKQEISILIEKIRDDEKSHKEALTKLKQILGCPIK